MLTDLIECLEANNLDCEAAVIIIKLAAIIPQELANKINTSAGLIEVCL